MRKLGGKFARMDGRLYEAWPTSNHETLLLLAHGDEQPAPGFESPKPGAWEREVPRANLDEYYDVQFEAIYHGLDCSAVKEDDNGRLLLLYLAGDSFKANEVGMMETDHGVWEKWVNRDELHSIREVRRDLLHAH